MRETPSRRIVFSVLIASIFILFTCFYNETIHHLQIQSGYTSVNVYSWPRLMLIPGFLLFAVIGDWKNGKYVPIASLCIMLIALLNVILIGNAGAYWLNMCLFYFAIAAFSSYYLLIFWRLAPGTRHPAFWAPFGRMLDSAMVLSPGPFIFGSSAPVVLGLDIAGLALVILLMAISGDFNFSTATESALPVPQKMEQVALPALPETDSAEAVNLQTPIQSEVSTTMPEALPLLSPEEALEQMQIRYNLTRRETEVLRELVLTEDKQTVISERLSIQPRTLQNHVTQLYRKTGAGTRSGLTELFHQCQRQI